MVAFSIARFTVAEEFLLKNPELYNYTLSDFVLSFLPKHPEVLLIQAHPNRPVITPVNPELLEGFEAVNLNFGHMKYANAKNYANLPGKIITSSSDCHSIKDVGRGGIISDILPKDSFEYAALLRSGKYELLGEDLL